MRKAVVVVRRLTDDLTLPEALLGSAPFYNRTKAGSAVRRGISLYTTSNLIKF
jgi:hypothetical protein